MPYKGIFKVEFEKTIFISKINTLESAIKQSFVQNKETSNFEPKMPYFRASVLKSYCHIWNQHSPNYQNRFY